MKITTFNYRKIVDLCIEANEYIYIISPGIFEEIAETLLEKKRNNAGIDIVCVVDPTETAFRSHHGVTSSVSKLLDVGIEIRELLDHRLSFIITERQAFFFFQSNRSVEEDPNGPNAVEIPALLKAFFIMQIFKRPMNPKLLNVTEKEFGSLLVLHNSFKTDDELPETPPLLDKQAFEKVADSIQKNPPKSPDTRRLVQVYTTRIRFVEFEVKGIHVERKTVKIPNKILNLADTNLRNRIKATISILDEDEIKRVSALMEPLEVKIKQLRSDYLKNVSSRNKNVILVDKLFEFKREIQKIKKDYDELTKQVIKTLNEARKKLEDRLADQIEKIFTENAPFGFPEDSDSYFIRMRAEEEARDIKKPTLDSLLKSFKITYREFDPTWNDFQDKKFVEELYSIGFINASERDKIVSEFEAIRVLQ
ncbi:MAG: taxilin [Balneolales bacterium]|nr:taxilin [Balneolales bacterium]